MRRGVYFIANNKVYDLAVAFLNSFRVHNPDLPLCLIPYDRAFNEIEKLKEKYNFDIFEDHEIFNECDDLSVNFHDRVLGAYRKLACWEGIFDEFIYIDVDTVVLENVDFAFQYLDKASIYTSHSNIPSILKWVWKDSIYDRNILDDDQIQYAANTGFIVSKKGTLSVNVAKSKLEKALLLKDDMELFCMEQPFLNYLIVTSGLEYSSLTNISHAIDSDELKFECWAGTPGGVIKNGTFFIPGKEKFFLIHWAGLWQNNIEQIPYKEIWLYYKNLS